MKEYFSAVFLRMIVHDGLNQFFNQYVIQAIVRPLFRRLIQTALRGKIRLLALSERDGQRWKGEPRQENKIKR